MSPLVLMLTTVVVLCSGADPVIDQVSTARLLSCFRVFIVLFRDLDMPGNFFYL